MVGLLDLPLELREPILLDVVVDTIQEQPENPTYLGYLRGYQALCSIGYSDVFCKSVQRHAMALLQVNQQIRYEVIDLVLRRLGQRFNDAKVDAMYVRPGPNGTQTTLNATWLSEPFPTTHLNRLHVQIRCFQASESLSADWGPRLHILTHPGANSGDDCRRWLGSENAALLLEFVRQSLLRIKAGCASSHVYKVPSCNDESGTTNRTIQKLVIDIPFESDAQPLPGERVRCMYCPPVNTNSWKPRFHPIVPSGQRAALVFAQSLQEQLLRILEILPKHGMQRILTSIIFESVGTIELNVHGRLFRSFDLSRILAEMPHIGEWDWPPLNRTKFFEWKRAVEEKRRVAGFEVVKPSVQEHYLTGSLGLICSILAARDEMLVPQGTLPTTDAVPQLFQLPWRNTTAHEIVAFTGSSVLVQEDGTKLSGDTTFYTQGDMIVDDTRGDVRKIILVSPHVPFFGVGPVPRFRHQAFEEQSVERQPEDGQHVVFKGEAIFIATCDGDQTITSGDATFYGRAEGASTEQPVSIPVDHYEAWYYADTCDTKVSCVPANKGGLAPLE